jgi:hypothetical protein
MVSRALRSQILAGVDTAWRKLQSTRDSIGNYRTTVNYNQALLDSALTRLQAGQIESGKLLEIEGDLLEAKNSLAESLVHHQVAFLELEVILGTLLHDHNIEITQESLQAVTRQFVASGRLTAEQYQRALTRVQRLYQDARPLETSGQTNSYLAPPPAPSPPP